MAHKTILNENVIRGDDIKNTEDTLTVDIVDRSNKYERERKRYNNMVKIYKEIRNKYEEDKYYKKKSKWLASVLEEKKEELENMNKTVVILENVEVVQVNRDTYALL
jgi:hypothetical protein